MSFSGFKPLFLTNYEVKKSSKPRIKAIIFIIGKERLIQHPVLGCIQHPLFPQARINVPRKCNQHIKPTLANTFCQPIINVAFLQNSSSTQAWPNHSSWASHDQPFLYMMDLQGQIRRGCIPIMKWLAQVCGSLYFFCGNNWWAIWQVGDNWAVLEKRELILLYSFTCQSPEQKWNTGEQAVLN